MIDPEQTKQELSDLSSPHRVPEKKKEKPISFLVKSWSGDFECEKENF